MSFTWKALCVVVLLCLYVYKYQPSIVRDPLKGFAVAAVLAVMLLATKMMVGTGGWNPYLAAFCIFTAAAILCMVPSAK